MKVKKILFIEDEEIFIELFGDRLKRDGFELTFARNGTLGIEEAMVEDFTLYIMDMMMPAMGGEEMLTKLKNNDKTKNVPTIVLSASVDKETQKRVERMGINAFYIKTHITPSELSRKVGEILGAEEKV